MAWRKQQLEDLKLSNRQTERLIELYHKEVDLWDTSSKNCYKKDSRQTALQNITETLLLEYPGLQCTVEQVQRKLSYIRGYYSRELGKFNRSTKAGAGKTNVYKSPWIHFKALDTFLRYQISPRTSHSNVSPIFCGQSEVIDIESDCDETASCSSDLSGEVCPHPRKKAKLIRPEAVMHQPISRLQDIKNESLAKQETTYEEIKNKPSARQDTTQEDIMNRPSAKQDTTYEEIKNIPLARQETTYEEIKNRPWAKHDTNYEDDDTIFGKYVISELRKINDERTKGLLKFKIQSLIFEAQFGNLGTYEKSTNSPV